MEWVVSQLVRRSKRILLLVIAGPLGIFSSNSHPTLLLHPYAFHSRARGPGERHTTKYTGTKING